MPIYIDSVGMATSLGNFVTSCAAARAGVSRAVELANMNFQDQSVFGAETLEGPPSVVGHVASQVPLGATGFARTLELAAFGLQDLANRNKDLLLQPTAVCLTLTDLWIQDQYALEHPHLLIRTDLSPSDYWRAEHADLLASLFERLEATGVGVGSFKNIETFVNFGSLHVALKQAAELLDSGRFGRVIVGAVESRTEPAELIAAAATNLLLTNDNPCGFIPGEAAVFMGACREKPADSRVVAIQNPFEIYDESELSESPPMGSKLSEVIDSAVGDALPSWIIGGLNGTTARSQDWGHALVKMAKSREIWRGQLRTSYPVLNFGETGVADPALAIGMCLHASRRGTMLGEQAVVWSASESGARQAFMLQVN